ncbi:hypothetical protein E4U58_006454 [Claviceps cyperi]|nr:hypothetical protein E4U58_006454 [Claviceps cyperi]
MPATFSLPSTVYGPTRLPPLESPVLWTSPVVDDVSVPANSLNHLNSESVWYMPGARDSRLRDGDSVCWYRVPPNYLRPSPSLLPAYVPYLLYCHLVSPSRVTPMDAGPRRALPRYLLASFLILLQRLHGLILLLRSLRPLIHAIILVQAHINHSHTHLDTTALEPALPQAIIIRILLLRLFCLFCLPCLSPLRLLLPNLFHSQNTVMHNLIILN